MWKLWHKLFGWEYVRVLYFGVSIPCRVKYTPLGDPYINWDRTKRIIFLTDVISGGGEVTELTNEIER